VTSLKGSPRHSRSAVRSSARRLADVGPLGERRLESLGVEFARVHLQRVAAVLEADPCRIIQCAAQPMYMQLELLGGAWVSLAGPERIHQNVHRHRCVRPCEQHPEQRAMHRRGQPGRLPSVSHPQRAENLEVHSSPPKSSPPKPAWHRV
jgi:hypothetical protein